MPLYTSVGFNDSSFILAGYLDPIVIFGDFMKDAEIWECVGFPFLLVFDNVSFIFQLSFDFV